MMFGRNDIDAVSPSMTTLRAAARGFLLAAFVMGSFSLVACEATRGLGGAKESGFLGNYSDLELGKKGEAQLLYIRPDVDWKKYDAVMIDSVTLWRDAETADVPSDEQQKLTDYLYEAIHKQLSQDFEITNAPGPGVLRVRAAITEAKGANVPANAITGVVPQLRAAGMVVGLTTGTATLVGKASLEGEITDSVSGERLMAAVDERGGTKSPGTLFSKWGDVEKSFDFWANRLRERLAVLKGQ